MCSWEQNVAVTSMPHVGTEDSVLALVKLVMQFGEVNRLTRHPDGVTLESDTTHSTMLGLVACSLAHRWYPALNTGRIAELSLVHDLPEAYAGDTPTLNITAEERAAKHARERQALNQIWLEFGLSLDWAPWMVDQYERQYESEERFVYAVDKILPKPTHILNGGAVLRAEGETRESLAENYQRQAASLQSIFDEFPKLGELYRALSERVLDLEGL